LAHLVEVAFRGNRKEFFLWDYPDPPPLKSAVIVDADRGEDLGWVHSLGDLAQLRNGGCPHGCGTSAPTRKALRVANSRDKAVADDLRKQNEDSRRKAMERVRANGLAMKLTDAEWQWDKKKLTFYFTAEKRVDFRNLVRDLASLFRTRIELKQIGVRDEAKRLDGIGRCGRQYCSASWLPELRPVNLGVAKDQRLSLNPAQISGACGRLMCCLRYEHEFYVQSRKRFPKEGKVVAMANGEEKVLSIDIFRERVTLRNVEGETRQVSLADFNSELGGQPAAAFQPAEDEAVENGFDVSPELLYTTEHEIPPAREHVILESAAAEPIAAESAEAEAGARRRRGRRGGRRGRGPEPGDR
jgi:cell fate regulator YaaT (PSP1 superfamily)